MGETPKKTLGLETSEPAVTPPPTDVEKAIEKKPVNPETIRKREIPQGLWTKCPGCSEMIFDRELEENLNVCCNCNHHFPVSAWTRINSLTEPESFLEIDESMTSVDTLEFTGTAAYAEKLEKHRDKTGLKDAVITGTGNMGEHKVALGVMDFGFLGGSMGSVVGEKITRVIEMATENNLPAIIISSSGGARMYEGMFSLMQLAKTSAAIAFHGRKGLPYISVLTHPTTAGVMASYASLGDIIISEPKAMIGFAGPRVIKDTTQSELPEGFQTAEFLMERGLIDSIVNRTGMKKQLTEYLDYLCLNIKNEVKAEA